MVDVNLGKRSEGMSQPPGRRFLFTCVSETAPGWLPRVLDLVYSLRQFGGAACNAPFVVNFVGHVPPSAGTALLELGADSRSIEPIGGTAPGNKLRMLDLHEAFDFDFLVALDCDTVVVGDVTQYVPDSKIGAKPVDFDPLPPGDWRRLYRSLEIEPPDSTVRASSSGEEIQASYNSGVLTVPYRLCAQFETEWRHVHAEVVEALGSTSTLLPRHLHFFADQMSLALWAAGSDIGIAALPVAMNFPTHVPVHPSTTSEAEPPVILHYHDAVDKRGFLLRPRSRLAVEKADAFNVARASRMGMAYEGLRSSSPLARIAHSAGNAFWRVLSARQRARTWLGDWSRGRNRMVRRA